MIVDFSPAARNDLRSIGEWIARGDPRRAASFVAELIDRADALAGDAMLYPQVDARSYPGIRRVNYKGYRILYTVTVDAVTILHVHHGRRTTPPFPA